MSATQPPCRGPRDAGFRGNAPSTEKGRIYCWLQWTWTDETNGVPSARSHRSRTVHRVWCVSAPGNTARVATHRRPEWLQQRVLRGVARGRNDQTVGRFRGISLGCARRGTDLDARRVRGRYVRLWSRSSSGRAVVPSVNPRERSDGTDARVDCGCHREVGGLARTVGAAGGQALEVPASVRSGSPVVLRDTGRFDLSRSIGFRWVGSLHPGSVRCSVARRSVGGRPTVCRPFSSVLRPRWWHACCTVFRRTRRPVPIRGGGP